ADVRALVVPVERRAVAVAGEGVEPLPGIVAAGVCRGDGAPGDGAVRIAFALVKARCADQAEGSTLRQMLRPRAVVGEPRQRLRLAHAVDPLVWDERPRPAFVVIRVVLDQPKLRRLLDHFAVLEQVNS